MPMFLQLDDQLHIALQGTEPNLLKPWTSLFEGWTIKETQHLSASLQLQLVKQLPTLPDHPPYFTDRHIWPDEVGILSVYQAEDGCALLHFLDGAVLTVPLTAQTSPVIQGGVNERALGNGRLEDITFTSLAPILRRMGYYLVHAFAASYEGQGILIVGPSGSGKTTTGLNLILHGWQLISNDIVLLQEREGQVYALPTPGAVGIRPYTFDLLPRLRDYIPNVSQGQRVELTGQQLVNGRYSPPVPIQTIYFPQVAHQPKTHLQKQNRAISLAHLMEESLDRWDQPTLTQHINLLQKLTQQSRSYQLLLGEDMKNQPALLAQNL